MCIRDRSGGESFTDFVLHFLSNKRSKHKKLYMIKSQSQFLPYLLLQHPADFFPADLPPEFLHNNTHQWPNRIQTLRFYEIRLFFNELINSSLKFPFFHAPIPRDRAALSTVSSGFNAIV